MPLLSAVQALGLGRADERPDETEPAVATTGSAGRDFRERLRRGDLDALASAYDEHHAALCSFATRLLDDDHAAEDLVQDVFMLLPDVVARLEHDASLRSFLLGIAANRARHHARSRSRLRKFTARLEVEPREGGESPDHASERRLLANLIGRALATLPFEQRTTFVLKEVEGYAAKDVAAILQIPEATVRTRVFHARQRLRAVLAGDMP